MTRHPEQALNPPKLGFFQAGKRHRRPLFTERSSGYTIGENGFSNSPAEEVTEDVIPIFLGQGNQKLGRLRKTGETEEESNDNLFGRPTL